MVDKCLHPGSNHQLAPSCDHCSRITHRATATVEKLSVKFCYLSQTDKVLWEFYWNFPFLIFNDNDYDVVLF